MSFATCTRLQGARPKAEVGSWSRPRPQPRVAVCASHGVDSEQALPRRGAVLSLLGLLAAAPAAQAAFVDISDSRGTGAKEAMESADQARDEQLDERRRFSYQSVGKLSANEHQDRAKESYRRLTTDVKQHLDKKHLPWVTNELGLQIGSLRYDLQQLANSGDKATRKAAQAQSKQAIKALEELDSYARLGNSAAANEAYSNAIAKLGSIVKAYG